MNWKHVKHLLLLLLIAVNLLLGYFVYTDYSHTAFTDPLTAARTAAILEQDGIRVSEDLLAVQNDTASTYTAPYDREGYLLSAAAFLLGKEPDGIYLLPSGIRAETQTGESVYLGSDLAVSYRAADGGEAAAAALASDRVFPFAEEELEAAAEAFSALLDLPAEEIRRAQLVRKDGCIFLLLTQSIGSVPLADFDCTFGMADGRLVYAEGRHFFGAPTSGEEAPLLNRANILLSERDRGRTGTVTEISLCYALYEEAESEQLRFVPAYTVRYTSEKTSIVNAIDGQALE